MHYKQTPSIGKAYMYEYECVKQCKLIIHMCVSSDKSFLLSPYVCSPRYVAGPHGPAHVPPYSACGNHMAAQLRPQFDPLTRGDPRPQRVPVTPVLIPLESVMLAVNAAPTLRPYGASLVGTVSYSLACPSPSANRWTK